MKKVLSPVLDGFRNLESSQSIYLLKAPLILFLVAVTIINICALTFLYDVSQQTETPFLSDWRSVAFALADDACDKDDPATFEEAIKATPEQTWTSYTAKFTGGQRGKVLYLS